AVISKNANDHLFGGANSVGQFIQVQGEQIQVVGVVDLSNYKRRFQDLSFSNNYNHDAFIPLNYAYAQNFPRTGQVSCRTDDLYTATNPRSGNIDMLKSTECGYLTVWFQYQNDMGAAHCTDPYRVGAGSPSDLFGFNAVFQAAEILCRDKSRPTNNKLHKFIWLTSFFAKSISGRSGFTPRSFWF
ncbi:ABC transporter permease, partial [Pseudoalteromonas maricaloris]